MTATWTAPRTWTDGETVTKAILDAFIRDELDYLKAVLDGTSLQAVTIANAQAFKHGAQSVMRTGGTTRRHTEDGVVYTNTLTQNVTYESAVTFTTAFGAVPNVVITLETNAVVAAASAQIKWGTLGTAGFTVQVLTGGTNVIAYVHWMATGADS